MPDDQPRPTDRPFPVNVADRSAWLAEGLDDESADTIRANTSTGRPSGSEGFIETLEGVLGRTLRPRKTGRKPKEKSIGDGGVGNG
ncbi:hypothetical protein HYR69_09165 [Candidatus Sumerlaeota bacterium]|nr:hypothetical protein [Candidatus Sumerlaeota bacterium]